MQLEASRKNIEGDPTEIGHHTKHRRDQGWLCSSMWGTTCACVIRIDRGSVRFNVHLLCVGFILSQAFSIAGFRSTLRVWGHRQKFFHKRSICETCERVGKNSHQLKVLKIEAYIVVIVYKKMLPLYIQ